MDQRYLRNLNIRLIGLILIALTIGLSVFSYLSLRAFEVTLIPEIAKKAEDVGRAITVLVVRTSGYGIDIHQLVGTETLFKDSQDDNPEFSYYVISDEAGHPLYTRGNPPKGFTHVSGDGTTLVGDTYLVSRPIEAHGDRIGFLAIGIPQSFVQDIMREILLDLLSVLVVSLFLAYELLYFIAGSRLSSQVTVMSEVLEAATEGDLSKRVGLRSQDEVGMVLDRLDSALDRVNAAYDALLERAKRVTGAASAEIGAALTDLSDRFHFGRNPVSEQPRGDAYLGLIRTPLFLFIFAEEMSRSFLPLYVKQLSSSITWLSPQIVIGLPIMLFMFVVALSQPVIGAWSERVGRRRVFLIGAFIGLAGFALTALAQNLFDLLLYRSLTAVGYGMVFGAAQGYVLDNTGPYNRSRGLALFIGAIMVAGTCGPSIGGILADRIGFRLTFLVSTALTLLAAMVVLRRLPKQSALQSDVHVSGSDVWTLLRNPRMMALLLSASVPAKIILTAFAFYLIPLYITSIGSNPSTTGRLLMLYAIMMVFFTPVAAQISDRIGRRPIFVGIGLAISGLGGLLVLWYDNLWVMLAVVLLLGIGQSISIAPQSALVGELVRSENIPLSESTAYGVFRLVERLGNTAGPFLAALLLARLGFPHTFVTIGALIIVCALIFILTMRSTLTEEPVPLGLAAENVGMAG